MTHFISIQEALKQSKGEVHLRGWIYRERGSSAFKFIVLRDATNIIQCVIDKNVVGEEKFSTADKLRVEASLTITGELKEEKRAPTGYEVHVKGFEVIGPSENFPITKDQSPEFLLDNRHLWLRSRKMAAVLKVRHTVLQAFREFYIKQGFFEMPPPILQPTMCEGGSTLFEVKYYTDRMYLSQSWQLYGEAAIYALEKLFCLSPCFRAEKSKTSRHLSEFIMAEMEAAWYELPQLLDSIEGVILYILEKVIKDNEAEIKLLGQDVEKLKKIKAPLPRITYTDALKILKEKENMEVEWGKDLRTIEEDKLMNHFDKPVIVTHYPKEIMAFYKPRDPKQPNTALCVDVIAPEGYGEIVGGSQRSMDIEEMQKDLKNQGEDPKKYEWYFDLRRYGGVPHSGFGLGIERVVAWLCKLDNIKDAIPFPRTMLRKFP
jgi:asparaginyl-tRNA synthetase